MYSRSPPWRAIAIATGADREPGETHAQRTPRRTSSSTNVAANTWFGCAGASDMLRGMPELEVADGRLSYAARGTGPAVTLLHGFTQTSRSWQELIGRLPGGFRYLAPDLRGHGATRLRSGAPHTMEACLQDLSAIWAAEGVEQTHLVGYSMGGRLALYVAAADPERLLSLATIGSHAGMPRDQSQARQASDERLATQIEQRGVSEFVSYWASLPLFRGLERRGPGFVAALDADRRRNSAAGLAASLRGMGSGAVEPVWERLRKVECP